MKIKSLLTAVLLIIISLPAIYPIITPGYFPMHDDTQVVRVDQMYKALSTGQFPVRWVPDLGYGYGYPIFNFYNPLPYYFGALFMFLGADALLATKLMMTLGTILAGISMFIFTKAIFKGSDLSKRSDPSGWPALLASTLYLYAPYHAVQIYVRGAVAEYWAYAILPLVFLCLWKNKVILGGISLAALITSHNLTAFMSIPFIALLLLIKIFDVKNKLLFTIHYSLLTALALGASAFFWLPAIAEAGKTQVSQMVFENFDPPALHLIKPFQLWSGQWGYGGSSPGTDDGLSLQLGKMHLVGSLAAIAILLSYVTAYLTRNLSRIKSGTSYRFHLKDGMTLTIFSVFSLIFSAIIILPLSRPIWDSFPILSYIQFPWRFLTFASFFASILTAYSVINLNTGLIYFFGRARPDGHRGAGTPEPRTRAPRCNIGVSVVLGLSLLFLISSLKFFQPQFKYPTSARELTSRERILWEVSRRSDEYLPKGFTRPATLEETLRIDNPMNQTLVDGLKKPTLARRIGNIISIFTVIGMIGCYERLYRRRRR